jgi:hypothetical protein
MSTTTVALTATATDTDTEREEGNEWEEVVTGGGLYC